mmetsp:Transcript_108786/g.188209  ORF Transcript_108786/g.188209 Transcript_108786/m.188209 type:complete len:85 (-) Transcript_108786:192-446(-)
MPSAYPFPPFMSILCICVSLSVCGLCKFWFLCSYIGKLAAQNWSNNKMAGLGIHLPALDPTSIFEHHAMCEYQAGSHLTRGLEI